MGSKKSRHKNKSYKVHNFIRIGLSIRKSYRKLNNGYLYITTGAWGISSEPGSSSGTVLIQADLQGKYLNVTPTFIRQTIGTEKSINIPLIYDEQLTTSMSPNDLVSNKILNVLNDLSDELFGQASDGRK